MTAAFDKLKELLTKNGTLANDDVEKLVAEHGALTDDEKMWLESEKHRLQREKEDTVTMEQYLEALKVLDTAPEGSPEFVKAEALVNRYESGT
ncbi:MAG: hypothetical protein SF029_08020 [bacterium]|nr:hypothetical protein [bacterium]